LALGGQEVIEQAGVEGDRRVVDGGGVVEEIGFRECSKVVSGGFDLVRKSE
jgi:hypothetical protein